MIKLVVGFEGSIELESTKPDGTPRKLLVTARLTALGWKPSIGLETGIRGTHDWYAKRLRQ
jgi:GDP-L-fucose synthase